MTSYQHFEAFLDNLFKTNKSVHSYYKQICYFLWNNFPSNIRDISLYKMFKNKVKEYVIKK